MANLETLFEYSTAFSRNIGWITQWEQQKLRSAKVAVAGAGGVGGVHLQTLARLGFGAFHVADMDSYELANFNRQAGATMATLGEEKAKVGANLVTAINPEAQVTVFPNGVSLDNLDAFLDGVDVYIDGLDFFVLDIRAALFRRAREKGIPCVTAAPIGMGTGYLIFTPTSMSFDDFFEIANAGDDLDDAAAFLVGLTPSMIHRAYLSDQSRVDLIGRRGPSTAIACQLCAGVAAGEAVKLVLGRGAHKPAPYYHHFDAYRSKYVSRKLIGGAKNPLQRLKRRAVKAFAHGLSERAVPPEDDASIADTVLDRVIEAGRWAPSADNTQPWVFDITSDTAFCMTVTLDPANIYEYRAAEPTVLGAGMLLENMRLRAAHYGHALSWAVVKQGATQIVIECTLDPSAAAVPEPQLDHMIELRRVERAAMRSPGLTPEQKKALEDAVGPGMRVEWHESFKERLSHSVLNAKAAILRFKTPETIAVHQKVVQFGTLFPRYGLPAKALGLSWLARSIMRFALATKTRSRWLVGRLGGAYYAAVEMDIVPGLASSAHFTLVADGKHSVGDVSLLLNHGQRIQRFWLMCAQLNLGFQPACAPICFYSYGIDQTPFSVSKARLKQARSLAKDFQSFYGDHAGEVVFRGRVGIAHRDVSRPRSLRQLRVALIGEDQRTAPGESPRNVSSERKRSVGT